MEETAITNDSAFTQTRKVSVSVQLYRSLYFLHRWLGIATCVLCALWFVSGVVMVYVPYPGLSDQDKMTYSEPLILDQVAVSPDQALATAGVTKYPTQFKLTMLRGEPVYRILAGDIRVAISAINGQRMTPTTTDQAADVVRRLLRGQAIGQVETIVRDQWTVAQGFDPYRPLYRVPIQNPEGLTLYVSSSTGEVVNDTTQRERVWNWLGSIPHWLYLTVIRRDNAFWRQVIMWTSGPALIGALIGCWLGIHRARLKPGRSISPYRSWMKWHHLVGLFAGIFTVTWLFSGWLSVNPFNSFPRKQFSESATARYALHQTADFPAEPETLRGLPINDTREVRFIWVGGAPFIIMMDASLTETVFDARTDVPAVLTDAELFKSARALVPKAEIAFATKLDTYDRYWYGNHRNFRRLPVLRVGFTDVERTWVHIDPTTGEILNRLDRTGRTYRWLFNALHSLDMPPIREADLVRQLLIWVLSAGGLALSVIGTVIAWRHVKRLTNRKQRAPARLS